MRLFHGTKGRRKKYAGICLTEDLDTASRYGKTHAVNLDLSGLRVLEVEGYDRDTNTSPGDSDTSRQEFLAQGVDVIVYMDEDVRGRQHDCIRVLSKRALARLVWVALE